MSYTLLNAVNLLLVHVREVDSRGQLISLVDSARQPKIDLAVRAWNQAASLLFEQTAQPIPMQAREATITLEADKRKYPLAKDLIHIYFPLRHAATPTQEAQGYRIYQYAPEEEDGGYMRLLEEDRFPDNHQGRPQYAVITPDRRELYLDRTPTSSEAGEIYSYTYTRRIYMNNAGDTFPFGDAVVDSLVPVASEFWRGDIQNARDSGILRTFLAQAARVQNPRSLRKHW